MIVTLLPHGSLAISDAYRQREACAALDGAVWTPTLKSWIVDASPGNVASLAAMCPALPAEVRALMPRVEQPVIMDSEEWITYDAALHDPSLVWTDPEGVVHDDNRDRAKPPWNHQRRAVGRILDLFGRGFGAAALMEQRTGKARISIELFARLAKMDLVHRILVVSLSTPCGDYADQVEEYLDGSVPTTLLFGSKAQRLAKLKAIDGPVQVAIINYESSWRLKDELLAFKPDMVIADEMHKIKSRPKKTDTAPEFIRSLAPIVPYRLGMTGTATPKDALDIVGEYGFVEPSVFPGGYYASKAMYATEEVVRGMGGEAKTYFDAKGKKREVKHIVGYRRLDEFQAKMHSVAFVCRMDECTDLPPEAHLVVPVTLGTKAARAYRKLSDDSVVEWENGETSVTNILTRKMRLQQITSGFVPRDDGGIEILGTEKLEAFADHAAGLVDAGEKFVVLSRFTAEVHGALEVIRKLGVGVSEISGRIKAGSERDAEIERFKTDSAVAAIVCQIQANILGIDLSVARTELFLSKTHSFGDYDQARARIVHGSKKSKLTYRHYVVRGTVDEEIEEGREMKCDLSLLLLNRSGNPFRS